MAVAVHPRSHSLPPGPPPLGNNPWSLFRYFTDIRRDPIAFVGSRFAAYGDLYYSLFRGAPLYVTRHPEHINEVLVTQGSRFQKTEKGITATRLAHFLGDGLLTSNGDHWRHQRRLINPAFNRKAVEAHGASMVELTGRMLERWHAGQRVDVSAQMMGLTLAIVNKVLFDHDVRSETDAVALAMSTFRTSAITPQLLPDWVPLPQVRRTRDALELMDRVIYGMIDRRRAEPRDALAARGDLLSLLLCPAGDAPGEAQMGRKQLRDELLTLFVAGHDTTSHLLSWTLYLLSQHPEIEQRMWREIDAELGGQPVTPESLSRLPFGEQVVNEALRLYPPAYATSRTAIEPAEVGGYVIPAGAEVIIWIYLSHHDGRWFPDPERFDPERFAPGRIESIPRSAFIPFGAGTRTCIGKHFAMMEARLIVTTVLQRWRLRLQPGHVVHKDLSITLAPRGGLPMIVEPRAPGRAPARLDSATRFGYQ